MPLFFWCSESPVLKKSREYKSRVLSAAEDDQSEKDVLIEQVTDGAHEVHNSDEVAAVEEISDATKKEVFLCNYGHSRAFFPLC